MTDFLKMTLKSRGVLGGDSEAGAVISEVEKVIIKASSKEGFTEGLYATISVDDEDGKTRTYRTPLTVEHYQGTAYCYVKRGLAYSVEVDSYGDTKPDVCRFTANNSVRNVSFYYDCNMAPLGAWIEATDGSLISSGNWSMEGAGKIAQSVILITVDHQFRIGLTNAYSEKCSFGGKGRLAANSISNADNALDSFNSRSLTDSIITAYNPNWNGEALENGKTSGFVDDSTFIYTSGSTTIKGAPAAEACRVYSSGNIPAGKWDLPTLGCLWLIAFNKSEINKCLSACGGTVLTSSGYHWSSVENGSNNTWYLSINNGSVSTSEKHIANTVRAVSDF